MSTSTRFALLANEQKKSSRGIIEDRRVEAGEIQITAMIDDQPAPIGAVVWVGKKPWVCVLSSHSYIHRRKSRDTRWKLITIRRDGGFWNEVWKEWNTLRIGGLGVASQGHPKGHDWTLLERVGLGGAHPYAEVWEFNPIVDHFRDTGKLLTPTSDEAEGEPSSPPSPSTDFGGTLSWL